MRTLTILAVSAVVLAACGGGGSNYSSRIADQIKTQGQQQLRSAAQSISGGAITGVNVNDVNCIQTSGTQQYTCIAHYTTSGPGGSNIYELNLSATCDSSGSCQWHAEGQGNLTRTNTRTSTSTNTRTVMGGY